MALYPGSLIRLEGRFYNAATNQPADAARVTLKVLKPDGTEHEGAVIVHDGVGRYRADIEVQMPGRWQYRWQAGQTADQGEFQVERSAFV